MVATITGGTILWFVLFLVQLPFYGWFDDHGHLWWVWTCLAGGGLGLIGIWYVRGRDAALKRHAAATGSQGTEQAQEPKVTVSRGTLRTATRTIRLLPGSDVRPSRQVKRPVPPYRRNHDAARQHRRRGGTRPRPPHEAARSRRGAPAG